jgi:hypothetical protein
VGTISADDRDAFDQIVRQLRDTGTVVAVSDRVARLMQPKRSTGRMPEGWYVIRVELLSGNGEKFDPPPGWDILASPHHTFRQLADVINTCFARWDLGHLYVFRMQDGTEIGIPDDELEYRDSARSKIATRREGEVFEYEFDFDFGDGWTHRCTVLEVDVTPEDHYGVRPKGPVATWGWGTMPDQYGRTTPQG